MMWIKASERLPGWYKEVKWRHPSAEIVNELMWTSVAMELCSHLIRELEWLDETQQDPNEWDTIRNLFNGHAKVVHLIGFLESNGYKLIK